MGFTSYVVDNDKAFRSALNRVSGKVSDLTIPLTLIAKDFYRSEKAIFQLKGPGQYPPFKNSQNEYKTMKNGKQRHVAVTEMSPYQKRKIKKWGFDYPLLVASGKLRDSLTDGSNPNAINQIQDKNTLIIGTSVTNDKGVCYPVFHQSDDARTKIPLRKFLFIGPEAPAFATSDQMGRLTRWTGILQGYYESTLSSVGAIQSG